MTESFVFTGLAGNVQRHINTTCLSTTMDDIKNNLVNMGMKPIEREWKQLAVLHGHFGVILNGRRLMVVINLTEKSVAVR